MSELNQLLLDLNYKQNFNDHDFYVSKSNYFAFNIIDKWPKWEKKILNICGEKFSGKTHLANIFKSKSNALLINHSKMDEDAFNKIKLFDNIIIDDFNNNFDEKLIYSVFNLVDQDNKFMLINSEQPINEIKFNLPDMISRSKNCLVAKIEKDNISLEAELFSLDGKERFYYKASKELKLASELGKEAGTILKKDSKNSYKK